jgi:transposase
MKLFPVIDYFINPASHFWQARLIAVSTEAKIIELYLRHHTQDEIAMILKTGHTRVSRDIREFKTSGIVFDTLRIGILQKATRELVALIEARRIQQQSLPATRLSDEIQAQFGVKISPILINTIHRGLRFQYRPPRHNQILRAGHLVQRLEFCEKMLGMPEALPRIHFLMNLGWCLATIRVESGIGQEKTIQRRRSQRGNFHRQSCSSPLSELGIRQISS